MRIQRGWRVDAGVVIVTAFEIDIFGTQVRADLFQEIGKRHTAPTADNVPAFDANMASDLLVLRQLVQLFQRPRTLVGDQSGDFQLVVAAIDFRHFVNPMERIERKWPSYLCLSISRCQPFGIEQPSLDAVVRARDALQHLLDRGLVGDIATDQKRQATQSEHAFGEQERVTVAPTRSGCL